MLTGKQQKCLKMLLEGTLTDEEIAEACDISRRTLSRWKNEDENFQNEYKNLTRKNIQYTGAKALQKQIELLNSKSDMVAHLAAKDLLDRSGFSPENNINLNVEGDMDMTFSIDYGDQDESTV